MNAPQTQGTRGRNGKSLSNEIGTEHTVYNDGT